MGTSNNACVSCQGRGVVVNQMPCSECLDCAICSGRGSVEVPCRHCAGSKQVMALDIRKLCRRQSMCVRCRTYFPEDQLLRWPGCRHAACVECCQQNVNNLITCEQVPQCMANGCSSLLTVQTLCMLPMSDKERGPLLTALRKQVDFEGLVQDAVPMKK